MAGRVSLPTHVNVSQLTVRDDPNLARRGYVTVRRATRVAHEAVHISGSAGPKHRFGDEVGAAAIFSRHAETAASPKGGAQGRTAYLAPHPSGWQGGPAPRGDHRRARTTREQTSKIDTWAVRGTSAWSSTCAHTASRCALGLFGSQGEVGVVSLASVMGPARCHEYGTTWNCQ
jgi:hypothetical protein